MFIKGRKKEMIVTPEGLNVFPEDVERVLNELPGVRESAVVGVAQGAEERVHAVLVRGAGDRPATAIVRDANARLQDHQRIRAVSVWPGTRAAAHRRHAQAETARRSATGCMPGEQPLAAPAGRLASRRSSRGSRAGATSAAPRRSRSSA